MSPPKDAPSPDASEDLNIEEALKGKLKDRNHKFFPSSIEDSRSIFRESLKTNFDKKTSDLLVTTK